MESDKRNVTFQDLPLLDNQILFTVIELSYSDKQVVNEMIYRWCRVITRAHKTSRNKQQQQQQPLPDLTLAEMRRVLILDLTGSLSIMRLLNILKQDNRRSRIIGLTRGCKINSSLVTLHHYICKQEKYLKSIKLLVIYHDEFFIDRTLTLLSKEKNKHKFHILLIVPKLHRNNIDFLQTITHQKLTCNFVRNRREIGESASQTTQAEYSIMANQVKFSKFIGSRRSSETFGEIKYDGLYLNTDRLKSSMSMSMSISTSVSVSNQDTLTPDKKRHKTE